MPDPKNEDTTTSPDPATGAPDSSAAPGDAEGPAPHAGPQGGTPATDNPRSSTAPGDAEGPAPHAGPQGGTPATGPADRAANEPASASEAETVAIPAARRAEPAPSPADAPTARIAVTTHTPKQAPQRIVPQRAEPQRVPPAGPEPHRAEARRVEPQRIEPRRTEPQRVQPQRAQPVPGPQRIDPVAPGRRGRRGWVIAALVAGLLVVAAVAAAAVKVYLDDRAANSPEARIRATVETFVGALAAGDLTTLRTTTCGGLQEFYASVPPEQFADIHRTAVDQGTVPVVTGVDKVQITDGQAIAQVTAHPAGTPTDVTQRTFDLAREGEDWKVCGE
ncbi:hypothetical protein CS378_09985 [Rhodococcus ruber]|uniref:Rv0361 family membrane protein n=1 Tax=Rhodococcus TaxID=1827 RepID=UPI00029AFBCB|nr:MULTISPECIES: hypothetical protein [Rhodococcus]ATQ29029.1 hypothetical protein CS378_09985 [Rhodococcus ruber]MBP2213022.1 hypothetical protein [Rhodococcus ruber]WKK09958.1 hypothetical protein QYN14_14475 [Rhodococcus ruber]